MSKPATIELSHKEIERLESELETVTTERDTLKSENETLKENAPEHTQEDFVTLEEEKAELESKLETAQNDLAEKEKVVTISETLKSTLEENYQALYISLYYDGVDSDLAKGEAKSQMKDLNVLEIYNSVTSMRRSLAKKNVKGRQSSTDGSSGKSKNSSRIPAHINEIGI